MMLSGSMRALVVIVATLACAHAYTLPLRPLPRCRKIVLEAEAAELPLPETMRVKALQAELDERGVAWRGVAFEKVELVSLLSDARTRPAAPAEPAAETVPEPEPSASSPSAEDDAAAYDESYASALADSMKLKVKELRTELAARNVGWADLFEKEELAARLAGLIAQSALFSSSGVLSPGKVGLVDGEQLQQEMADARTPLLVDVFATWCGPCKLIAPQLEAIAAKAGERLRIAKLDSDEEPELSTELRIAGLPTLIFLKGGQEVHRLEGVPGNAAALEGLVNEYLGVGL